LLALRKALSERIKEGDLIIVDEIKLQSPKTREMVGLLKALGLEGKSLVVVSDLDRNLKLAARNIPDVILTTGEQVSAFEVLYPEKLLVTKSAFEKIEDRLLKA